MLVDKESEIMSDLLFTVHQHGGDDVTKKTTHRKPFLALLGDRSSYSYFPFNRQSENRAQSYFNGKPRQAYCAYCSIRLLVNLYQISMQEDTD